MLALQSQAQRHTQQQLQEGNPNLSPRQMLAAQQHFGFGMQQPSQQQQREGQPAGSTPSGGWNDDSELFLRNLLASNMDSPLSSNSGASYMATSPSYVNGGSSVDENRNSLSPGSSAGFQSLHDFIHNNNLPTPPNSDNSAYGGQGAEGMNVKPAMIAHPQQHPQQMMYAGQQQNAVMDPNALEYFVNSMVQNGDQQMVSSTSAAGLDPSLVSPVYNYMGGPAPFSFQPHVFGQQGLPPQQYQQMLQQQSLLQQQNGSHPALEGRKRSAPGSMTSDLRATNKASNPTKSNKKVRKQSSFGKESAVAAAAPPSAPMSKAASPTNYDNSATAFLPRMEVGSNATALAAIERLKAKRRAEVEQRIKQEENLAAQPKKEGGKGESKLSDEGNGSGEPAQKNQKKVAHNAIERRYRNNINDRITALRNAVPALRELRPKKPGSSRKGKGAQEQDLVDGVPAATKLNKATILGKATEYIRYLKGRETRLVSEVAGLRELIRSLEGGEELLDLWEGEMEKVVAEQEAKAKAAFAMEDESFGFGGDDDDDEDEEEEDFDVKPRSSSGSSASSRYMMGIFMGFSVLGGGAELMSEHAAMSNSADQSIVRASSGRVLGASHQLLKRGMTVTNVKLGSVADLPHHFDHVPSHLLAVEVMRGLALLACLVFIFWPLVGRFITGSSGKDRASLRQQKKSEKEAFAQRRKEMLGALARSKPRPHEMDVTMRKFVGAPANAVHGGLALAKFASQEMSYRLGLASRVIMDEEQTVVWCRLLELETSLGPLAHRSLLARLHTILTVATMPNIGYGSKSESTLLNPARVYGTIAIAMVRAARGNGLVLTFAEKSWNMARKCRLLANDDEEDEPSHKDVQDRWLDSVLEYSLADAIALCPSPTAVASIFSPKVDSTTLASLLAPLPSIAAIQHSRQLTQVWGTLLGQIVKSTCPPSHKDNSPTAAEFMKHHSDMKIYLSLVSSQAEQDKLSAQISRLALTSPKCEHWQTLSNVTFGTWALLIGNVSVARSVAAALLTTGNIADLPASAIAFVKLVFDGNEGVIASLPTATTEAINEVDALAAASLTWLQFLKLISASIKGHEYSNDGVASKALSIRRLLATARMARVVTSEELVLSSGPSHSSSDTSSHRDSLTSTASSISEETIMTPTRGQQGAQLDESLDTLTDVLALLGRKAALGTLDNWKVQDGESEQHDSGVEWGV